MTNNYTQSPRYRRCQAIFDRTYPDFRDAGQRYADMIAAALDETRCVLDVGCGRDSLAAEALRQAAYRAGIDLSFSDLLHNTSMDAVTLANAEHLPFPDAHFDVVVSQWVIEHFANPDAAFAEMARVLRPGGRLVFLTTNANNYIPLFSRLVPDSVQHLIIDKLLRRPAHESFPTVYRANTRRAVERIAGRTGFTVETFEYVGNPFYMAFNVLAFRGAMLYERITDWQPLNNLKLYIVATLQKD